MPPMEKFKKVLENVILVYDLTQVSMNMDVMP